MMLLPLYIWMPFVSLTAKPLQHKLHVALNGSVVVDIEKDSRSLLYP